MSTDDEDEVEDDQITCWCGTRGTFDELFSKDIDDRCGGSGYVNCYCGGDQCFCHWHGQMECDGCDDCDHLDDEIDWDEDEEDY